MEGSSQRIGPVCQHANPVRVPAGTMLSEPIPQVLQVPGGTW